MNDASDSDDRAALEVTDEMIEAGTSKLFEMLGPTEGGYSYEEVCLELYKVMLAHLSTSERDRGNVHAPSA